MQTMVRPAILALLGFPCLFLHQVACRIVQFFVRTRRLLEFQGILSPPRCPLIELPTEVIEEIFRHIDWQSLLRVRTSCSRLNMVSRSLSVWRGQHARYVTANPRAAPLDAPMDSYSPSELEQVVLQRSAVEPGWLASQSPASTSTIPYTGCFLHLVEGGRWLLSSEDGSVIAYDLDSTEAPGRPLIPEYAGMPVRQRTLELSVDVLRDTSTFTFNIAIEQCSDHDDIPSWTHLWQVTMHGCATNAELQAVHLRSFTTSGLFWCVGVSLRDRYYARSVISSPYNSGYIHEIYVWGEANLHENRKAAIKSSCDARVIRILPDNRLLVFEITEIKIYEIPPFETVPVLDQNRGHLVTPLYSVLLPGSRLASNNISSIIIQPSHTYSLIACTNSGILAVTLSPTASRVQVLFTLPDEPSSAIDSQVIDVRVGWRRAYIQYYEDALAVSYDTRQPVAAESCAFRHVVIPNEGYGLMDENSGRVVIKKSESLLVVYYYSLYDVDKIHVFRTTH